MNNTINSIKKKSFNLKNTKSLFYNVISFLEDEVKLREYVTNQNALKRKRKLTSVILVKLLFAKAFISLSSFLCMEFKNDHKKLVSKQAFSKARKNISFSLFIDLNKNIIKDIYQNFKLKTFNNKYLLFSIDGTTLEIPNTKILRDEFGHTKGQIGAKENARASASCIYDSINSLIITSTIEKYNTSERSMAINMIDIIKNNEIFQDKKILYLMDRGYFSREILTYFILNKQYFLFRLKEQTFSKYFNKMSGNDEFFSICLNNFYRYIKDEKIKQELNKNELIVKLRFTKVILKSGEVEYLLSNIEDIPYSKMKELYFFRWRIEENYKFLKCKLKIENFSGKTKLTIFQDFYSTIVNANIQLIIRKCVCKKKSKYNKEYQVNKNLLASLYKDNILSNILLKCSKLCSNISKIINYLYRFQVIKPLEDRTFYRNKNVRVKANLFCTNLRPI